MCTLERKSYETNPFLSTKRLYVYPCSIQRSSFLQASIVSCGEKKKKKSISNAY